MNVPPDHLYSTLSSISAPISLVGSSAIIYVISKSREKLKTTLNRLLFSLCIGDIMMSLPILFSKAIFKFEDRLGPNNIPLYSIPVVTNQAACSAQGFFILAGVILSPFYNCALCVYYLFVIKFNYSDAKIKKKIEPFLHAVPWTWASISAIYALGSKALNPNFSVCWTEPAPLDCTVIEGLDCERGDNAEILRWVLQAGPGIIIFVSICCIMAVLYLTVWKQERRMRRYDHRSVTTLAGRGNEASMIAGRQSLAEANAARGLLRQNVTNSRKVLNQALAYLGAYLCSHVLLIINLTMFLSRGKYEIPLLVLQAFFFPLQGFLNFTVFIYPRVTRQLRRNHHMNVMQALWAAVRCAPLPPRRAQNRGGAAVGSAGANSGPRNISGLGGSPCSHKGRRVTSAGNRSGQRTASSLSTSSGLTTSGLTTSGLSDDFDAKSNSLEKKIRYAGESSIDDSKTRVCHHRPMESVVRKSDFTAISFSKSSAEDNVEKVPDRLVDESSPLEMIAESDTLAAEIEELGEDEDIDAVGSPEEPDSLKLIEEEGNWDEEAGFLMLPNVTASVEKIL